MKWQPKENDGDERTITRFAFLPQICDDGMKVWLEKYCLDQIYDLRIGWYVIAKYAKRDSWRKSHLTQNEIRRLDKIL